MKTTKKCNGTLHTRQQHDDVLIQSTFFKTYPDVGQSTKIRRVVLDSLGDRFQTSDLAAVWQLADLLTCVLSVVMNVAKETYKYLRLNYHL